MEYKNGELEEGLELQQSGTQNLNLLGLLFLTVGIVILVGILITEISFGIVLLSKKEIPMIAKIAICFGFLIPLIFPSIFILIGWNIRKNAKSNLTIEEYEADTSNKTMLPVNKDTIGHIAKKHYEQIESYENLRKEAQKMSNQQAIRTLYNLEKILDRRKRILIICVLTIIAVIFFETRVSATGLLLNIALIVGGIVLILLAIIVLVLTVMADIRSIDKINQDDIYFYKYVEPQLKKIQPETICCSRVGIYTDSWVKLLLPSRADSYYGSNLIKTKIKDRDVVTSNMVVTYTTTDSDGHSSTETSFDGCVIKVSENFKLNGHIRIVPTQYTRGREHSLGFRGKLEARKNKLKLRI